MFGVTTWYEGSECCTWDFFISHCTYAHTFHTPLRAWNPLLHTSKPHWLGPFQRISRRARHAQQSRDHHPFVCRIVFGSDFQSFALLLNPELFDSETPQFACTGSRRNPDCCCPVTSHNRSHLSSPACRDICLTQAECHKLSGSMRHSQCGGFPASPAPPLLIGVSRDLWPSRCLRPPCTRRPRFGTHERAVFELNCRSGRSMLMYMMSPDAR